MSIVVGVMASTLRLILVLGVMVSSGYAISTTVARVHAEGTGIYIPVERRWLQEKLNEYNADTASELSLPDQAVFKNQPPGTHPVLVDVSEVTFTEFIKQPWDRDRFSGVEVAFSIPFLSATPGGPISYSLGLEILYDGHHEDFPRSDFLYDYIPVSYIDLQDGELRIWDRESKIHLYWPLSRCDDSNAIEVDAVNTYTLTFRGYPDFDYCHSGEHRLTSFCSTADEIEGNLYDHSPDICTAWASENERHCEIEGEALAISVTGWFQNLLPVERFTKAVAVEEFAGDYGISVKYPCVHE